MFFPEFWSRGFATEAVLACLDYGITYLNLEEIIAITQEANINSRRLLERVGMQLVDSVVRFGAAQCIYKMEKK